MNNRSIAALFLLFTSITLTYAQKKEITNEDIWEKELFKQATISGLVSMNDGHYYSSLYTNPKSKETFILQYEYATGKIVDTILRSSELVINGKVIEMEDYTFSPTEDKILIYNESDPIYRHSTKEENYVWDRKSHRLQRVSEHGKQMYAAFSPDGTKIAFVRDNNIFVYDIKTQRELQITQDGKKNAIINGACDWVYEEEFSFTRAFQWSPDSKYIAYYKFDESRVRQFTFSKYGKLYPEDYTYKYPKAGEDNSLVSIHIYTLDNQKTVKAAIENLSSEYIKDSYLQQDQYIPRIKWTANSNILCILRMNRLQNKLDYILTHAQTGKSDIILAETSKTYIEITDDLTFLKDGKSFIISSEKDGYNHLYHYDIKGNLINQITHGNWEVTSLYGIDPTQKIIYYQSAQNSPLQREIYSIGIDGKNMKRLSQKLGTNKAVFSSDFSYFINYFTNANTPNYITVNKKDGKEIRVLEDNASLKKLMETYQISKKDFFTITTSEGVKLNAWMIKPDDFDPKKKYPVFMFVYGGPGSQTVQDNWGEYNQLWYYMLASKGYIIVSVDNRGTGARGAEFKQMTYLNLGKYETIDQIESAKWLAKQSYVDPTRIGIQGWSYGGYMSSLCITKGADVFKMAIAGAPVTNWKYYDTIYTERYLRTPKENSKGYEDNSPINFANQLKGNYLIIHGTADDNVHFQNSMDMVTALINAGKQFESAYYPNKNHSIKKTPERPHLYILMTNFILKNL